ncbi:MAG: hypothetical protein FWD90_05875 [Defluviitaleaceae bacterium]|nr:hypothetical protein [Defluviitaleaceae bacterium]
MKRILAGAIVFLSIILSACGIGSHEYIPAYAPEASPPPLAEATPDPFSSDPVEPDPEPPIPNSPIPPHTNGGEPQQQESQIPARPPLSVREFAAPSPEGHIDLLAQSGISEYGWYAAADFMTRYPAAFGCYGWFNPDTGTYWHNLFDELENPPLVGMAWEAMLEEGVESDFLFYHFSGNGIPDIFILSMIPHSCAMSWLVYSYVDGGYTRMGSLPPHSLYYDEEGVLVMLDYGGTGSERVYYYNLWFLEDGLDGDMIAVVYLDVCEETYRVTHTPPVPNLIPAAHLYSLTDAFSGEMLTALRAHKEAAS